ncbi:MAG: hypothetical protein QN183_10040 [Armatimonadota bacterium]|nr:hypothetical protein [Armatimonadota bacterium]MDR7485808.1 hypothetical protein [Armatimonadota bacterium]MDR7532105.1 hypothetical protein [Armatimonadota bacterium]MDR7536694.1 hypothetical protein [Armatimonadota bacterium]
MSSHFHAVGFPVREMREYWRLGQRAVAAGERLGTALGHGLFRWAPGGGPEIWALADAAGEVVSATPFFATDDTYRLAVTGSGASDEQGLEGWVDGWLNPTDGDEPFSGAFPLRVDVVNYALVAQRLQKGAVVPVRLVLLLHEATLYPTEGAYAAIREREYRPPLPSVSSSAHFDVEEAGEEAEATALVVGHIVEALELINTATEAAFWWMRLGVAPDLTLPAATDREVLPVEPRVGNVVAASGWVLGEVLEPAARSG